MAGKNSVLSSDIHYDNPFMRGFLSDIYLRPSCYECKCKNGVNHSDLTIADFWGINKVSPNFDDDLGIGLVLVNSEKGKKHFHKITWDYLETTLQIAISLNGGFKEIVNAHPKRETFFRLFCQGYSVAKSVDKCLYVSIEHRLKNKIMHIVMKMLKHSFI